MSGAFGIQDAIVALLALAALGWLVRRNMRRRKRGTCTCDGCPVAEGTAKVAVAAAVPEGNGLVTIDGLGSPRK